MKIDRRRFLSFLGVGAASGPAAVKSAADMGMADLVVRGHLASQTPAPPPGSSVVDLSWAKKQLKRLLSLTPAQREQAKREMYLDGLEPNIATFRSVSIVHKITWSRERLFERHLRERRYYLFGLIRGWWD